MVYRFVDCELDEQLYHLRRNGELVPVEPKVFDVLAYLIQNRDRVVSKDELLDKLWPGQVVGENALTRCIRAARVAVGDDGTRQEIIETQHGRGYRFVAAVATPVTGDEDRVLSQEEAVRSQPVTGENGRESSVQGLESKRQSREFSIQSGESAELLRIGNGQALNPGLSDSGLSDPRRQTLDATAPVRSWSIKTLLLVGGMLLVGAILTRQYLARPFLSPQHSVLGTEETQSPALPLPDKPSIAVLPFANISGDPAQEYFSDGLTDDLTTDLSQFSSLFVIARYSSFTYKGKPTKVQEIGRELGVRYVLQGSVQKGEDRVRVNAQLVDATTGYHLWSERYDRPLAEIFAVQDEIRQQIVANLQVEMYEAEIARVQRIPTVDLTAYDLYLRGREVGDRALFETKSEANAQARELFEKAIELDPHYASAYAQLGFTYWLAHFYGWEKDRAQALEQAFTLVQKAVVLDASLPAPHRILGQIYFWKRQYDRAISEMERAIALNPNNADGYERLGNVLGTAGQPKEAISLIEKAMRLNPRYPSYYLVNLGIAYLADGRCEEALIPLKKVLTMTPNFTPAHTNLAICYAELGRLEEAKASAETVMRLNPQFSLDGVRRGAPIKDPALLERHIEALRKAGLK